METIKKTKNFIIIDDCSLKKYNTLRIESKAKVVVFPLNSYGVQEVYEKYTDKKIVILGNGSNILFSKQYYNEDYIFMSFKHMNDIYFKDDTIYAETGVTLSELSWFALEKGIQGFEFLEDVPGSVGGATIMNAGTYQDMIGDILTTVTYYSTRHNKIITEQVQEEFFGKRYSIWGERGDIIVSVSFQIQNRITDYESILDKLLENKKTRYMKQPRDYPNAGSVFKRPQKDGESYYVWKLFEGCNLRGFQIGSAMISDKHPGFIVNIDNATPEDILSLLDVAQTRVKSKYDIDLELEWKII